MGGRKRPKPKKENMRIPTKEDLQEVLKICDPLERAIILVGVSSGLSANEIQNLTYADFKKGYDSKTNTVTLDIRRGKTDVDFFTFLNPEATNAILDYLDFRIRSEKTNSITRNKQLEKQRVTEDSYLFVARNVPDSYLKTWKEGDRKLNENIILKMYRSISVKARKNTKAGSWNLIRSHNIRKYFNSTLINNGCNPYQVDLWLGHELGESKGSYIVPDKEKQRAIYIQFMPFLALEKHLDISDNPDFLKMKSQNDSFARLAATAAVERSELQELKKRMQRIDDLFAQGVYGQIHFGEDDPEEIQADRREKSLESLSKTKD